MAQLERERERERDTGSDSGGEFWEAAGIYIIALFQFKVHCSNCEQHSCLPEHVNMFISYIYIYEIGYCYEDRR